jgi:hypothetical protein
MVWFGANVTRPRALAGAATVVGIFKGVRKKGGVGMRAEGLVVMR